MAIFFVLGFIFLVHLFGDKIAPRKRAFIGFSFYLFCFLIDTAWLIKGSYHGIYIRFSWFFLGVLFSVPFFFWFYSSAFRSIRPLQAFSSAVIFSFLEYLRLYVLSGFPFSTIGSVLAPLGLWPYLIRFFGVYGATAVAVFFVLIVSSGLKEGKKKWAFGGIMGFFLFSVFSIDSPDSKEHGRLGIVQPGLKLEEKYPYVIGDRTFIPILDQLKNILNGVASLQKKNQDLDFFLFPEGVFLGFAHEKIFSKTAVIELFNSIWPELKIETQELFFSQMDVMSFLAIVLKKPVVFGANRLDDQQEAYNSMIVLDPDGGAQFYDKRVLVPMGETLPFQWLDSIAKRYGINGFFRSGKKVMLQIGHFHVLPSICYEDCFPLFQLSSLRDSFDFIMNITNDGWFYPSALPEIHAHLAKIRAIETGSSLVRCCENGYSGAISSNGSSFFTEEGKTVFQGISMPIQNRFSLYRYVGEGWLWIAVISCFGLQIFNRLKERVFQLAQKLNVG